MFPELSLGEICRALLKCGGDLDTCTHALLDHPVTPATQSQERRYTEVGLFLDYVSRCGHSDMCCT